MDIMNMMISAQNAGSAAAPSDAKAAGNGKQADAKDSNAFADKLSSVQGKALGKDSKSAGSQAEVKAPANPQTETAEQTPATTEQAGQKGKASASLPDKAAEAAEMAMISLATDSKNDDSQNHEESQAITADDRFATLMNLAAGTLQENVLANNVPNGTLKSSKLLTQLAGQADMTQNASMSQSVMPGMGITEEAGMPLFHLAGAKGTQITQGVQAQVLAGDTSAMPLAGTEEASSASVLQQSSLSETTVTGQAEAIGNVLEGVPVQSDSAAGNILQTIDTPVQTADAKTPLVQAGSLGLTNVQMPASQQTEMGPVLQQMVSSSADMTQSVPLNLEQAKISQPAVQAQAAVQPDVQPEVVLPSVQGSVQQAAAQPLQMHAQQAEAAPLTPSAAAQSALQAETTSQQPLQAKLQRAETDQPVLQTAASMQVQQPAVMQKAEAGPALASPQVQPVVPVQQGAQQDASSLMQDNPQQGGRQPQDQARMGSPLQDVLPLNRDAEAVMPAQPDASASRGIGETLRSLRAAAQPQQADAAVTSAAGAGSFQQQLQQVAGPQDAAAAQQPQSAQQDYQIPQQIVEQARLLRRGTDTQMVINLKPEHLGQLTLKVTVSADGAVNASFHSNNAEVRTIIANSLQVLRNDLNQQGIRVDNVDVYAGLDGGLPQQDSSQQGWQQQSQQHQHFHSAQESAEAFEDESELAEALQAQREAKAAGVDYRV